MFAANETKTTNQNKSIEESKQIKTKGPKTTRRNEKKSINNFQQSRLLTETLS